MKNTLLILFVLFSSHTLTAQHNIWGRYIGGTMAEASNSIMCDPHGNIYIAGVCDDSTDFDPGPATLKLQTASIFGSGFIAKYNRAGELIWAKAVGTNTLSRVWQIAVDKGGNVYGTGTFRATGDFNPGPATFNLQAVDSTDGFIVKLDSSGNFKWASQIGGPGQDLALTIALDSFGHVYAAGSFYGRCNRN